MLQKDYSFWETKIERSILNCRSFGAQPVLQIGKLYQFNLVGEEVLDVAKLVVDHKGQHTHLGSTSLVQLDGTLLELGFLIEGVPAEVDESVSVVS